MFKVFLTGFFLFNLGLMIRADPVNTYDEPLARDSLNCTLCKLIITQIENVITANATEQQIIHAIEGVCNFTGPLQQLCDTLVETYTPTLIDLLIKKVDPATICKLIGMCTGRNQIRLPDVLGMPIRRESVEPKADPIQCTICQTAVQMIEHMLQSNQTEAVIVKELEAVCKLVPEGMQVMCKTLVDNYAPVLIEALINKEDPKTVCTQIQLCPTLYRKPIRMPIRKPVEAKLDDTIQCTICQTAVGMIENLLQANQTETIIIKQLEAVCKLVPEGMQGMCKSLVDDYAPVLIQLLVQQEDPKTVCKQVKLCPESYRKLEKQI